MSRQETRRSAAENQRETRQKVAVHETSLEQTGDEARTPAAILAGAQKALEHYACSCEKDQCAMSIDEDGIPVDETLCGRKAADALAALAHSALPLSKVLTPGMRDAGVEAAKPITVGPACVGRIYAAMTAASAPAVSEPGERLDGALLAVAVERRRQIEAENFDASHDDMATRGQLAGAAACYALNTIDHWAKDKGIAEFWPWEKVWWKPKDRRHDLIRAAALLIAEIERLDRIEVASGDAG